MVDFRYHVVSIIAVFLALAVGIVMGTTVVDEAVVNGLRASVRQLTRDKDELRHQVEALRDTAQTGTAFHRAVAPLLIGGRLAGRQVTVVAAPQVDRDVRNALVSTLDESGARVAGVVRILPKLYDAADEAEVDDLVNRLVPDGVDIRRQAVPERAAALLAGVLGTKGGGGTVPARAAAESALAGLDAGGLIDYDGRAPDASPLVVVLLAIPDPGADDVAKASFARSNVAMLALVDSFARTAQVTLAAAGTGGAADGSALRSLRSDSTFAARVASVDVVDTDIGRIAVVLALDEALRTRETGHYGTGAGAEALTPPAATLR